MAKLPYPKPALSYPDQLDLLKRRGLLIEDDTKALHLLAHISYYRLSGYWYPMLAAPKVTHQFKPGSTFEGAFRLNCFDRELRQLVFSELEKIEVAIRAKMSYILSHAYGPFWFADPDRFKARDKHTESLNKLSQEFSRSDEAYARAFREKYEDPLPPSWMLLEMASFGLLSAVYSNLMPGKPKRSVARYFGLDDVTFTSWLHMFTYIRNICAHHSRLWNRTYGINPKMPKTPSRSFLSERLLEHGPFPNINKKFFFLASMIIYFLNTINPNHHFRHRLQLLLEKYPSIDLRSMGFPDEWADEALWRQ